jgi:hypothetical protein
MTGVRPQSFSTSKSGYLISNVNVGKFSEANLHCCQFTILNSKPQFSHRFGLNPKRFLELDRLNKSDGEGNHNPYLDLSLDENDDHEIFILLYIFVSSALSSLL